MDARFGQEQAPTLGAYLVSLHPGCECVCCGAALRGVGVRATADSPVGTTAESGRPSVAICLRCGSELADVAADEAAAAGRVLDAA